MLLKKRNKFITYFALFCVLSSYAFVNSIIFASDIKFGYSCFENELPPLSWVEEFSDCGGKSQSPIDVIVNNAKSKILPPINFNYDETDLEVENNGHTIQANVMSNASVTVDDKEFSLLQFHWHTPSEHWMEGENFPMELHLVHQDENGTFLVIGAFVVEGKNKDELDKIWTNLPEALNEEEGTVDVSGFQLNNLIPTSGKAKTLRYSGSFTTPPCTEGVNWVILANPIELSSKQIKAFKDMFLKAPEFPSGVARPLQPLNRRIVEKSFLRK